MRSVFLILIALLFSFSAISQDSSMKEGKGQFLSTDDDSLNFVKTQLMRAAFDDILTKEFTEMGLDQKNFWERYESKFEEYFAPTEAKLREKFGIKTNDSALLKTDFQKELRTTRLNLHAKFGNLESVISSYSVSEMSRSTEIPNNRYITIVAKVDRNQLGEIYSRFTRDVGSRHFSTLYIDAEFLLEEMSWKETGVQIEDDFTTVIKEQWQKILTEKLVPSVSTIVVVTPPMREKIQNLLKDSTESYESLAKSEFGELKDALFMKFVVRIKKTKDEPIKETRNFVVEGDYIIQDLLSRKVVADFDFGPDQLKINFKNDHNLSSTLASHIYQKPTSEFNSIKGRLTATRATDSMAVVRVKSVKTVRDVFEISKSLSSNGSPLDVEAKLQSLEGKVATIDVKYRGSRDDLIKIVNTLNDVALSGGGSMKVDSQNPLEIEIRP